MPLYREWSIDNHSLAAIWQIEEPEEFFQERTAMQPDIKSDKRRLEHMAGRFLLTHLQTDFPILTINKDEHGKPRVGNNDYYFSISHSWPFVAAVVSNTNEAGIDIQTWHPRMHVIQDKFLSQQEQEFFNNDLQQLALAWCVKEAAYKWQGKRDVSFINHLQIMSYDIENGQPAFNVYMPLFSPPKMVQVSGLLTPAFACAYVADQQDWAIY